MDEATMSELREFFRSVHGRTEDPNSKNPLTPEEIKIYAQLRISGMLDEYGKCLEEIMLKKDSDRKK
jgi:hypothetical protein